ncbi:Fe-S cluster assembly protein HesB [Cohnella sp. 56]|uniref:Fe-S cluster assembly protein HesB n=1 Tax=Cohnella sp. 56 TaxID=3113722 RepID=UPI0030EB0FE1
MELRISQAAAACFLEEWGYRSGDNVRIFVRYISGGTDPYGFGIMLDDPVDPAAQAEANGLHFYMEDKDIWFIEHGMLSIDCDDGGISFKVG